MVSWFTNSQICQHFFLLQQIRTRELEKLRRQGKINIKDKKAAGNFRKIVHGNKTDMSINDDNDDNDMRGGGSYLGYFDQYCIRSLCCNY